MKVKDIIDKSLSIQTLTPEETATLINVKDPELWEEIFKAADVFSEFLKRPLRKLPTLRGKTILNMFFEPSTRTQASFDLAAKRLSADTVSVSKRGSAVEKGETLLDTLKNIEAMQVDAVVIRHSAPGAPHFLARHTQASVINAGDGAHEHPTQALLDIYTMLKEFGDVAGKRVLIVGDILHSRVARSDIWGFAKMGAKVVLSGPATLMPLDLMRTSKSIARSPFASLVEVDTDLDRALEGADVVAVEVGDKEDNPTGSAQPLRELFSPLPAMPRVYHVPLIAARHQEGSRATLHYLSRAIHP